MGGEWWGGSGQFDKARRFFFSPKKIVFLVGKSLQKKSKTGPG